MNSDLQIRRRTSPAAHSSRYTGYVDLPHPSAPKDPMPLSSVTRAHLAQLLPLLKPIAILPLPPRAPFNLRVLGGSSGNTPSWEDIPRADGYELQMSTNGDFSSATTISSGTSTSFTDVTHSAGTNAGTECAGSCGRVRPTSSRGRGPLRSSRPPAVM